MATLGTWDQTRVSGGIATKSLNRLTLNAADPANRRHPFKGAELEVFHFTDVNDGDQWASGIPNILAVAWQPDQASDDWVAATNETVAGSIIFGTDGGASANVGWLWVLRGK